MNVTVISGCKILRPSGWKQESLFVSEGKFISEVPKGTPKESIGSLNFQDHLVFPGLVDAHVHFRDGALSFKETLESGSGAALAGGVTSCLVMANGDPKRDTAEKVQQFKKQARSCAVKLYPIGAVTENLDGKKMVDFQRMLDAGCIAFSDDGNSLMNTALLREVFRWADTLDFTVILHEEDRHLSPVTGMHEGVEALRLGLASSSAAAESTLLARDLELLLDCAPKAQVHIAHVSTLRSLELIREAKKRGLRVSAEVTPHHLYFNEARAGELRGLAKMSPPLRDSKTQKGLWKALISGEVDLVATDHAPHTRTEKAGFFDGCPCGVVGLETALSTLFTLCRGDLECFRICVERLSSQPANLFRIPAGSLNVGAAADFVVFDPKQTWTVTGSKLETKSKHTPWEGESLQGRVVETWINGERKYAWKAKN